MFSLSVSCQRVLHRNYKKSHLVTHFLYHYTIAHMKSWNHPLSLHRPTFNSSSTTNFQSLSPTDNRTLVQISQLNPNSKSNSKLLYDWQFTTNQFVLGSSPLRPTIRDFFPQLNPWDNSPYVTLNMLGLLSSVHFEHIACYWKVLAFALHTNSLSVQA
jgi:hypothetical protein